MERNFSPCEVRYFDALSLCHRQGSHSLQNASTMERELDLVLSLSLATGQ